MMEATLDANQGEQWGASEVNKCVNKLELSLDFLKNVPHEPMHVYLAVSFIHFDRMYSQVRTAAVNPNSK